MRLDDGFRTLISFGGAFGVTLWEKEVTPPGMDGGGPVDTTTMRNSFWRTRNPRWLITLTDLAATVAYDPFFYTTALTFMNVNTFLDVQFPDTAIVSFWGFLDKWTPNPNREGEQPTANIIIVPTNQDENGFEVNPVYVGPPNAWIGG